MSDFFESLDRSGLAVVAAFASGDQRRFEWGRTLARIGLPHVLVRDSTGRWYLDGVAGIGDALRTIGYLADLRRAHGALVTLGLSSGSYAALYYGLRAGADEAIAVSPVTGNGDPAAADFEPRWHHRVGLNLGESTLADLKPLFAGSRRRPRVRAFVSNGDGTELDAGMARRIGVADESITLVPGYDHGALARGMVERGMIDALLSRWMGP